MGKRSTGAFEHCCFGLSDEAGRRKGRARSNIHSDPEQIAPLRDLIDCCKTANTYSHRLFCGTGRTIDTRTSRRPASMPTGT